MKTLKRLALCTTLAFLLPVAMPPRAAGGMCPGGSPCVTSADIVDGQVGPRDLANSAVTGAKIKANAVTGTKVLNGSLTGDDLKWPLAHTGGHVGNLLQIINLDPSTSSEGIRALSTGYGIHGITRGNGAGVAGSSFADAPQGMGGYFETKGDTGYGVYGLASAPGAGINYGGYFEAFGDKGRGVYSYAHGTQGYAIWGYADGPTGRGVIGQTPGADGKAIWGEAPASTAYAGWFNGRVAVSGNLLVAGQKLFAQPHPRDPSKELAYVAAEAPEAVVFLRGTGTLREGEATIELPEYFRVVAAERGIMVQVTPLSEDTRGLAVVEKSRERIRVRELMRGKNTFEFDYLVTAVRAGFEGHQPVVANTHFRPEPGESARHFEERFSRDDLTARAMRALLVSNGLLSADGKLNLAKVRELGWNATDEPEAPAPGEAGLARADALR